MNELKLQGCGTALVTPFKNGQVDYEAYAALIDRQVAAGVQFFCALATTGETPTLSAEEKIKLLQLTHEHAPNVPTIVGCGSNSVDGTLANMALLEPYGVDAWLVVVPFYNKPPQEGQYQYFKTIAASTTKPVIIYNVPGRTGANMTAQTCIRLANDCENIIATKEASGKIDQIDEIIKGRPEGFSVLSGDDDMTLEVIRRGGDGVVSVASNIAPAEVVELCSAALAADWAKAQASHDSLAPLFKACFVEPNPMPAKAALKLLGLCSSEMRLPLVEANSETVRMMDQILKDLWQK